MAKAAAKKAAAGGKAMAKWDEELAKRAEAAKKMEEDSLGAGNSISTKGGILSYKDNVIPGNKLNAIILGSVFLNTYYVDGFDPDNPSSPVCYAIHDGPTAKGMAPHEKSTDKQHEECAGCPQNVFGTADKGRAKACQNRRRLALITEDALETGIGDAQVAQLLVPVTSVRDFAKFTTDIAETLKRPPLGIVSEISLVPNTNKRSNAQWVMKFKAVREVPEEQIGALLAKADSSEVKAALHNPFMDAAAQPKPKKPSKALGKKTAKRR